MPQFLIFNDGCVELSWKWGVPKQYLKWEVVPDQPVEAEKPRLITFLLLAFLSLGPLGVARGQDPNSFLNQTDKRIALF